MFCRLRGIGRTSGATENDSPTACPGGRIRILADDQYAYVGQRPGKGAQDVVAGRQPCLAGRGFLAKELADDREGLALVLQHRNPGGMHELFK